MHIIVSDYISRIYLALEKTSKGLFKTPKMYKVSKCSDIMEFLSFKQILDSWQLASFLEVLTSLSYYLILFSNTIEHAIEKLNTKLFYHRKLNHIPLHFTDKS